MEKRSFRSVPARLALLALAMLGAALLSLCLGAAAVSPREILSVLSGGGKGTTAASILLYVRLPRTLGCLLAGAALAVSGAVIQTVLANPLAAPNIIGVNSGAGLGVALCCAVLPTAAAAVPFAAFLGAFAGVMLVLLISEKAGASRMTLVLAGVAISGMFGAGIDAVLTVFPDSLIGYSDFRIGGLANLSMGKVAPAAWVILLCLGAALALANEMDVLALGADTARSLGLRVRGVRVALLALAAAGAPEVYKLAARRFLGRAKSHTASWLYILLDSFLTPVAGLFRVLLGAAAVKSLPFELVRDAVFLQYLNLAADLLVIFYIALGCWRAAPVTRLLLRSAQNHLDLETNQTMGHFFENIFHALVGLFAGIAMLDRLGVPVSGLLTGAGVAGLAVSLAAQSTLNSLIAGITLVLERPFGIGDYIVLGDCEGTVEDISFRSTRIRSPDNVAITIENSKITAEYIQNYDRRQSRLWKFTIGLTYDTPREKIEQLTADLTAMLQAQPDVQPDGVTIALDKFNDYSIDLACRVHHQSQSAGFHAGKKHAESTNFGFDEGGRLRVCLPDDDGGFAREEVML